MASIAECSRTLLASKIKIEESGRYAVFINIDRLKFTVVRADGCLYRGLVAADFIVCGPPGDLIVGTERDRC